MPSKVSAGLLMYRWIAGELQVFLAHPGGPFFAKKDSGHWTIPKGEVSEGEDPLDCARREFQEETGMTAAGDFLPLGSIKQKGGKLVHGWAFLGDRDESVPLQSNLFSMEWPPKSGRFQCFPEIDRAQFFTLEAAKQKLKESQHPFLDRLAELVSKKA
jgi:predicted NUDIX family NTP pyrophosphohydrolase